MPRHFLKIDDISNDEVNGILNRAFQLKRDPNSHGLSPTTKPILGLVFLQTSLRTRTGFEVACSRLGWQYTSVLEQRASKDSMPESIEDTVRVVAGMSNIVVGRFPKPVAAIAKDLPCPLINAGDAGPAAEHPSEALIDLFAILTEAGPVEDLHIAICGDLRFRTVRSLVHLLKRYPPKLLSFFSVSALSETYFPSPPAELFDFVSPSANDLPGIDVLYVAGMPHKAIPEDIRDTLRVTPDALRLLKDSGIIISPLPVIDEIDPAVRNDSRCKIFKPNDNSTFVRMSLLEWLIKENL